MNTAHGRQGAREYLRHDAREYFWFALALIVILIGFAIKTAMQDASARTDARTWNDSRTTAELGNKKLELLAS